MIVPRLKLQTYNEAQKVLVIQHPMLSFLLTRVYGATKSKKMQYDEEFLSHDIASGSDIMPCNKIDKTLVIYRFRNYIMTSIST